MIFFFPFAVNFNYSNQLIHLLDAKSPPLNSNVDVQGFFIFPPKSKFQLRPKRSTRIFDFTKYLICGNL
jgi:hypothetical protein